MKKNYLIKEIVIGIIILFIGASILPIISGDIEDINKKLQLSDSNKKYSSNIDWWSMFHHDPLHTGYSTSQIRDYLVNNWSFKTSGCVDSPIVVNNIVYVGSGDGYLHCINAISGKEIWDFFIDGEYPDSPNTPAVVDDRVYFGGVDGCIYSLNATTGEKIWTYLNSTPVPCWIISSPTVVDGRVYIGSGSCYFPQFDVLCLDAKGNGDGTTDLVWYFDANDDVYNSPVVVDGKVYVGNDKLYCLDALNGNLIRNTTELYFASSPTVVNGKVYIGSLDNNLYCLDADNLDVMWTFATGDEVKSTPAVADGKVFVGSMDNSIYCLDAENGNIIWQKVTDGMIESSPAVADGKVYVGSGDDYVYCFNASDGSIIWKYKTGDNVVSSPAVADGKVYIGSDDTKLYEFEGEDIPPEVSFIKPEYGHIYIFHGIYEDGPFPILGKKIIIIGGLEIWVYATDNVGIDRVEFYVNNVYKGDFIPSVVQHKYLFDWRENFLGFNSKIKAKAFDISGNSAEASMNIWFYWCIII